jgi:uncharacterized membrane protein YccC
MKPRVSIGGLMVLVLFAAIGFAALRTVSEQWASAVVPLNLAILSAVLLYSVTRYWDGQIK